MDICNNVSLLGNACADPEVRYSQDGTAFANVRIATNRTFRDKAGDKQERSQFHRLVFVGKLAEIAGEYLKKGKQFAVNGSLENKEWTDKDEVKHYTTEVRVLNLKLLADPKGNQAAAAAGNAEEEVAF